MKHWYLYKKNLTFSGFTINILTIKLLSLNEIRKGLQSTVWYKIKFSEYFVFLWNKLAQLPYNQTNSSNPTKTPYSCSGVSPYTLWTLFIDEGITMNIDTSNCTFNSTPPYFTSIAGDRLHRGLVGYGAIYNATRSSFTIYARSTLDANNSITLSSSVTQKWNVNWFGILE